MRIIGITGGIGAGKSVATDYLRECGFTVIDADEVAREAVMPGEPALAALVLHFGSGILTQEGELDRSALATLAFASEEGTKALNDIMHADIGKRIMGKIFESPNNLVFLSAPLLFEGHLDALCDEVWLITAPEDIRIERAAKRDGLTKDDIAARAARQMSDGKRRELAQVVIENTGSREDLIEKISALFSK